MAKIDNKLDLRAIISNIYSCIILVALAITVSKLWISQTDEMFYMSLCPWKPNHFCLTNEKGFYFIF